MQDEYFDHAAPEGSHSQLMVVFMVRARVFLYMWFLPWWLGKLASVWPYVRAHEKRFGVKEPNISAYRRAVIWPVHLTLKHQMQMLYRR